MFFINRYSYRRLVGALALVSCACFIFVALATFSLHDPSFFYSAADAKGSYTIHNSCGIVGAYAASLLLYLFGCAAWLWIAVCALSAGAVLHLLEEKQLQRYALGLSVLCIGLPMLSFQMGHDLYAGIAAGGLVGRYVVGLALYCCDAFVVYYATIAINFLAMLMIVRFWWARPLLNGMKKLIAHTHIEQVWLVVTQACARPWKQVSAFCKRQRPTQQDDRLEQLVRTIVLQDAGENNAEIFGDPFWDQLKPHEPIQAAEARFEPQQELVKEKVLFEQEEVCDEIMFNVPSSALFKNVRKPEEHNEQEALARLRAKHLENKLELFGVTGQVISITTGPVVTLFEYAPANDVKVSKILALEDDLSLALEAHSLRIIAPIPGRAVVGFEVANTSRQTVYFADIAAGKNFKDHKGMLPLIIGRDTVGNDVVVDLTDMPHLLVAGSTGSGKSVALNTMLVSLLCKVHPDEVNLILIDPKRLEFSSFARFF